MSGVIANKRNTESKYVSVFADSRPDVDVTFGEELLSRPTDHFMVGVDNLTVSLNSLSMLDVEDGFVIRFGAIRRPGVAAQGGASQYYDYGQDDQLNMNDDFRASAIAGVFVPGDDGIPYGIRSDGLPFYNVQQFLKALREVANYFNQTIFTADIAHTLGNHHVGFAYDEGGAPAEGKHLEFELRSDGKLEVVASRAFWANYFISIEKPKYQRILDGTRVVAGPKYIGLKPLTGHRSDVGISGVGAGGVGAAFVFYQQGPQNAADAALNPGEHRTALTADDLMRFRTGAVPNSNPLAYDYSYRNTKLRLCLLGNLWSTLDRRIALEMGCSLPLQNSPMIDHNEEAPDFALGRWMYNPRATQTLDTSGSNGATEVMCPSVVEYQNSTDRVCYHALRPQEKVQTIRLKLFVRVRAYNDLTDDFTMKTLECPTEKTDWWHTRLHFVSKD